MSVIAVHQTVANCDEMAVKKCKLWVETHLLKIRKPFLYFLDELRISFDNHFIIHGNSQRD